MRKKNTEHLRDVISQVLKANKIDKKLAEKRLLASWPEILGENILQYTSELKIANGVLYVALTSSVLRHDLFLSKTQIITSLNKRVGEKVITDIVFR